MNFSLIPITVILATLGSNLSQVNAKPVDANFEQEPQEEQLVQQYEALKLAIVKDLGYSKEFADMVEINLKRAIKEEMERQRLLAMRFRQGNKNPGGVDSRKNV